MNPKFRRRREAEAEGYRSGLEKEMADFLAVKGIRFTYETGPIAYTSPVRGGVCLDCTGRQVGKKRTYLPDFRVGTVVLETKGKLDGPGRTKLIAIKAANPDLDLRLVFQANNKIRHNSPTRYMDWAAAHGFKACLGVQLPTKWVKELKKHGKPKDPSE